MVKEDSVVLDEVFCGLLSKARQDSKESLGQLLLSRRPSLLYRANRGLPQKYRAKADGEDLVQETFRKAIKAFPQFTGEKRQEWVAWLREILKNTIFSFLCIYDSDKRKIARERRLDGPAGRQALSVADGSSPSSEMERQETCLEVHTALGELAEQDRSILELHCCDDLSYQKVGDHVWLSAPAARTHCLGCLEKMRQSLADEASPQMEEVSPETVTTVALE